jgi:hypothetical protein
MGSASSKKPAAEETKYLSPTGLYPSCNWDLKTIRKLIIEKKLAPFYPGREEKDSAELDECPICFMFYAGGLNRTKCCHKGVCTECFLQIKKPGAPLAESICPFCNRARFTVVFLGPKSREERLKEDMEEQKVLELQEKIRQEEIEQDFEREKQKQKERDQDVNKRDTQERVKSTDGPDVRAKGASSGSGPKRVDGRSGSNPSSSTSHGSGSSAPPFILASPAGSSPEQDLEDLMLMEAIRLSLIDNSSNNAATDARRERSSSPSPEDSDDDRADDYRWAGDASAADIDLTAGQRPPPPAAARLLFNEEREEGEESDKEEDHNHHHHQQQRRLAAYKGLFGEEGEEGDDDEEGFLFRKTRTESAGRSSSSSS